MHRLRIGFDAGRHDLRNIEIGRDRRCALQFYTLVGFQYRSALCVDRVVRNDRRQPPMALSVRKTRKAISPRFAMSTR